MESNKISAEVYAKTLERKVYLSDAEGSAYTGLSLSAFREWSKKIGARRKLGDGTRSKTVVVRAIVDKAIMEGKPNE